MNAKNDKILKIENHRRAGEEPAPFVYNNPC